MKPPSSIEITPDEQELILLGTESEDFVQNAVWLRLEKYMAEVVEDAFESIRGNASSDPNVAKHFQNIWREREAFRDKMILFVKGPIRAKKELLKSIEEEKEQYGRSAY